jgi:hypothetical protein
MRVAADEGTLQRPSLSVPQVRLTPKRVRDLIVQVIKKEPLRHPDRVRQPARLQGAMVALPRQTAACCLSQTPEQLDAVSHRYEKRAISLRGGAEDGALLATTTRESRQRYL